MQNPVKAIGAINLIDPINHHLGILYPQEFLLTSFKSFVGFKINPTTIHSILHIIIILY